MRKIITTLFILHAAMSLNSQILNQDADGKSSIVAMGGTINLDINATLIKANYYTKPLAAKGLILGVDLQGKNSEGIAGLFEDGNFSPDAEVSVLIGGKKAYQKGGYSASITYYTRIGAKASAFKYDNGATYSSVDTRFTNKSHVGYTVTAGISARLGGRVHTGLSAGWSGENNQSALKKVSFKYTTTDPLITGLQQSKDITAYAGTYGTYSNFSINVDFLYLIPSGDGTNSIGLGVYTRNNISGDKSLVASNSVLGGSLNFINVASGKFLGGVYLQGNDIFNNTESTVFKKIQFGLVARFSFSAISY